jgi:phosphoglycolate phosphatase
MATLRCGSTDFKNVEAVVFDKDGTLADSHRFLRLLAQKRARIIDAQIPGVQEPLLMAFGAESNRINPAGLMAIGTRHENEIAAAAYVAETGRDWLDSLKMVRTAFIEADQVFGRKAEQTPPFAGIKELLQALTEKGVTIAVLSGDTTANVQDFLTHYKLMPFVEAAIGSDNGLTKPDPQLLQQLCQTLNVSVAETVVIGDAPTDIEMAIAAAAMGCIGVTWSGGSPITLSRATTVATQVSQLQVTD